MAEKLYIQNQTTLVHGWSSPKLPWSMANCIPNNINKEKKKTTQSRIVYDD